MQALTNRSKAVSRKPMSFMERLYLPSIVKGMAITFSHIFKKQPTIRYPEQPVSLARYSVVCMCLTVMQKVGNVAPPADFARLHVPQRLSRWKQLKDCQEKKICIAKKNMQPDMRSICCVVSFADYAKKPVQKMPFILVKHLHHLI